MPLLGESEISAAMMALRASYANSRRLAPACSFCAMQIRCCIAAVHIAKKYSCRPDIIRTKWCVAVRRVSAGAGPNITARSCGMTQRIEPSAKTANASGATTTRTTCERFVENGDGRLQTLDPLKHWRPSSGSYSW
jgi:hypothetical protein